MENYVKVRKEEIKLKENRIYIIREEVNGDKKNKKLKKIL